jgi:hypothetical protein
MYMHRSPTIYRSVLLVEKTGELGENHWSVAYHWQTISHNVVSSTLKEEFFILSLPFGIFWPLYCLSFFALRLLLITLWYLLAIVLSVILRFTATSDYPLRMTDNTMSKGYQRVIRSSRKAQSDRQYNGQKIPKGNQK